MLQNSNCADTDAYSFFKILIPALTDRSQVTTYESCYMLSINDVKPDQREYIRSVFEQSYKLSFKINSQHHTLLNFQKEGVNSLDQLKTEARERFDAYIDDCCEKTYKMALQRLTNGETFIRVFSTPGAINSYVPVFTEADFISLKPSLGLSEQQMKAIKKLKSRKVKREIELNNKISEDKCNEISERLRLILRVAALYMSQTSLNLEHFSSDTFIKQYPHLVSKIQQDDLAMEAERKQRILDELLLDERNEKQTRTKKAKQTTQDTKDPKKLSKPVGSTTLPSKKKIQQQKQKTTAVSPEKLVQTNISRSLNSNSSLNYKLHSRIRRWNIADETKIKDFIDLDDKGFPVKKYEHLNRNELLWQQAAHNLSGIERLLSNKRLAERYSFKYIPKGSKDRIGRCFFAEMHYKGNKHPGMIHLGIGVDKLVYHAMFTSINLEQELEIKNVFEVMENVSELVAVENESWEQTIPCLFEMLENNTLSMNVKKQNVKFILHPLK